MAIPVLPLGTSALWPKIADLIVVAMVGLWLIELVRGRTNWVPLTSIVKAILILLAFTSLSFIIFTLLGEGLKIVDQADPAALAHGAYGLAKMVEFTVLIYLISAIPLDRARLELVGRVAAVASVIMTISFAATFFEVVSTGTIGFWLPQTEDSAGAWFAYVAGHNDGQGIGTVAYNRGFAAIQLLVMSGIALQLIGRQPLVWRWIVCISAAAGLVMTGSRSGMVSLFTFVLLTLWFECKRIRPILALGMVAFVLLSTVAVVSEVPTTGVPLVDRYLSILEFSDGYGEDGRLMIWQDRIGEIMDAGPLVWILGSGFGAAGGTGSNAHNVYLQIFYDLGIVGLSVAGTLFYRLIRALAKGRAPNIMAWLTVSLLVGAITQETFYPVVAFGDFLGFFLVAVVLTLAYNADLDCRWAGEPARHSGQVGAQ